MFQGLAKPLHDRRLADQRQAFGGGFGRAAQRPVLHHEPPLLLCAPGALDKTIGGKRLGDEVIGAVLDRLHRHRYVAVPRNKDHRQVRIERQDLAEKGKPVHAGHADIADDDAREVGGKSGERFGRAAKDETVKPASSSVCCIALRKSRSSSIRNTDGAALIAQAFLRLTANVVPEGPLSTSIVPP